jgi:predicted GIY-YIG superfamily endonuclease
MRRSYVTITTSGRTGRLFVGVTSALKQSRGKLVWYEECPSPPQAMRRGADIKRWKRGCKKILVERINPAWRDLSASSL